MSGHEWKAQGVVEIGAVDDVLEVMVYGLPAETEMRVDAVFCSRCAIPYSDDAADDECGIAL